MMRPRRWCLKRIIHSADAHLLHNLVKHDSIVVVHPGLGKLLLDVLEIVFLKLWYIPWFKIFVVSADVPVDSRLKVAELETLGAVVLQKVGLRILNEAEEGRERGRSFAWSCRSGVLDDALRDGQQHTRRCPSRGACIAATLQTASSPFQKRTC